MLTSDFPYFEFDFHSFNKVQSVVIPHITEDVNITIAFPTASGKTALAEASIAYHLSLNDVDKCIYVSPYRSLSMQKYEDWNNNNTFKKYDIVLCSSDNVVKQSEFESKRLILFTLESFNSKIRSIQHKNWITKVKLLIIDEAHLIGQKNRGDKLESSLMDFSSINQNAKIMLLSATMPNVQELSDWIKTLNNKKSLWFYSKWRPVKQTINLHEFPNGWNELLTEISNLAISKSGKIIIFVHSKKLGKEITKIIQKKGHYCAFHHGSLTQNKRKQIENAFNDVYSGLNILVSTSTLSTGVNLG